MYADFSDGKRQEWRMDAPRPSLDIIDRCKNPVLSGSNVRPSYMHRDYADEKRAAWKALGDRLTGLLIQGKQG